jgi:hypothetical protein
LKNTFLKERKKWEKEKNIQETIEKISKKKDEEKDQCKRPSRHNRQKN